MAGLLLALLLSYKVGVTMFVHTHNVDGTMVAHSHPFTNSNHSHSSSQVQSIALLSQFYGLEHCGIEEVRHYAADEGELCFENLSVNVIKACGACVLLRAPPVCC